MNILITGGCKNGKSSFAQKLAYMLSEKNAPQVQGNRQAGHLYYVATMIPHDEEDAARIQRHREDRAGLGFITLEWGFSLAEHFSEADQRGTYLLDSLTALLTNEMFHSGNDGCWVSDREAPVRIIRGLTAWASRVRNMIVVSDGIYSDAALYDNETQNYRAALAGLERQLARDFDVVIECCAGVPVLREGRWPEEMTDAMADWNGEPPVKDVNAKIIQREKDIQTAGKNVGWDTAAYDRRIEELIVGGFCQGKTAYFRFKYSFPEDKICDLRAAQQPDLRCMGFLHLESYIRRCTEQGTAPISADSFPEGAVIVCEDIFCGVVPIDRTDRAWRENLGRYLIDLSNRARHVTRIVCGISEKLR